MLLSIITPVTRVYNLPTIYKSILDLNADVEWILIFNSEEVDNRILSYKTTVPIKILSVEKQQGQRQRNLARNQGLENSNGDYIYYLDDDNLMYTNLLKKIRNYMDGEKLIIVNQYSNYNREYRLKDFDRTNFRNSIDTAQIIVPKKYKYIKWDDTDYYDEVPYLEKLLKLSNNNYVWVNRGYSYYNFLRRFSY